MQSASATRSVGGASLSLGSASLNAEYHVTLYTGGTITCGIDNCLRVDIHDRFGANGGVFVMEANGGWANLPTDNYGIVNLTPDTDELRFTVSVNYGTFFENRLTSAQHSEFAARASVIVTPTHVIPGNPNAQQIFTHTFGNGVDGSHTFSFEPNWVDVLVTARLEIAPNPANLLNSPVDVWTWETVPLRVRRAPAKLAQPHLLPLAIIGKPPGRDSWSAVLQSEGRVVKLGVHEEISTSVTHEASGGIGPIPLTSSDRVTKERREAEGTYQLLGYEEIGQLASAGTDGPGVGDLLVLLEEPTVHLYEAPQDLDYTLLDVGTIGYFAMKELLIQRDYLAGRSVSQSTNSFVRILTLEEIEGLIDLNPLLTNPHARLQTPRYHKVGASIHGQVGRSRQTFRITAADIATTVQASSTTTTVDDSFSITVPFSAVIKLITGVSVPSELVDPHGENTSIATTSVELINSREITRTTGEVFEYELYDSTGAEYCSEAYFDTLFNTLAFRDCLSPSLKHLLKQAWLGEYSLKELNGKAAQFEFQLLRAEADDSDKDGATLLIGSLDDDRSKLAGQITFYKRDEGSPFYTSDVDPKTGNFMLPNVSAGNYEAVVGQIVHRIEVRKDGVVTYKNELLTDAEAESKACIVEKSADECSDDLGRCISTYSWKNICTGEYYEETCETVKGKTTCTYNDNGKVGKSI